LFCSVLDDSGNLTEEQFPNQGTATASVGLLPSAAAVAVQQAERAVTKCIYHFSVVKVGDNSISCRTLMVS
jgi:hypothetical protein